MTLCFLDERGKHRLDVSVLNKRLLGLVSPSIPLTSPSRQQMTMPADGTLKPTKTPVFSDTWLKKRAHFSSLIEFHLIVLVYSTFFVSQNAFSCMLTTDSRPYHIYHAATFCHKSLIVACIVIALAKRRTNSIDFYWLKTHLHIQSLMFFR